MNDNSFPHRAEDLADFATHALSNTVENVQCDPKAGRPETPNCQIPHNSRIQKT